MVSLWCRYVVAMVSLRCRYGAAAKTKPKMTSTACSSSHSSGDLWGYFSFLDHNRAAGRPARALWALKTTCWRLIADDPDPWRFIGDQRFLPIDVFFVTVMDLKASFGAFNSQYNEQNEQSGRNGTSHVTQLREGMRVEVSRQAEGTRWVNCVLRIKGGRRSRVLLLRFEQNGPFLVDIIPDHRAKRNREGLRRGEL